MKLFLHRLLIAIPILFGVSLFIFLLFHVVVPDPAPILLGKNATEQQILELRDFLGLNRPLLHQYIDVLKSVFTFDFGYSWMNKRLISDMIKERMLPSLLIGLPGMFFSIVIGLMIAFFVAYKRGGIIDNIVKVVCVGAMSVSVLTYILFFQWLFAYKLGWFPISGFTFKFPQALSYTMLPTIIFFLLSLGQDVRFFRTVILDEFFQDYIRTARAKGLSERDILFKHLLKNILVPVITYTMVNLPTIILGALLLESFFSIPGLGGMTLQALNESDFPVVKAMAILSSVLYIIFNFLTDLFYKIVDPRIKL
jgi:peptide/nickel transport system permease protein